MQIEPTPWRDWIRAAAMISVLPEQFWRLSLREWRALAARPNQEAMSRAGFDAMAAIFPDRNE